ncbi:unnamed protein product [Spirodela intermedia]|uniref:Uncharacterized protein n=1 Tax=Spirodela intermedia TaxID=51605 RepID=A0A7I8JC17_SPIIN|nr:unnamed protein product [Spirodela intermedia]CAA6667511.1 unnamed protein product [Spirodela intermedia]
MTFPRDTRRSCSLRVDVSRVAGVL